jgi:hypothetical protein
MENRKLKDLDRERELILEALSILLKKFSLKDDEFKICLEIEDLINSPTNKEEVSQDALGLLVNSTPSSDALHKEIKQDVDKDFANVPTGS